MNTNLKKIGQRTFFRLEDGNGGVIHVGHKGGPNAMTALADAIADALTGITLPEKINAVLTLVQDADRQLRKYAEARAYDDQLATIGEDMGTALAKLHQLSKAPAQPDLTDAARALLEKIAVFPSGAIVYADKEELKTALERLAKTLGLPTLSDTKVPVTDADLPKGYEVMNLTSHPMRFRAEKNTFPYWHGPYRGVREDAIRDAIDHVAAEATGVKIL